MGIRSRPGIALVASLTAYVVLRVPGTYPALLANGQFRDLPTLAGTVPVKNYAADAEIYHFVVEHTSPGDTVLDIPYDGGINFAAHRLSPFFDTQFRQVSMADRFLDKDLEGLRRPLPKW